MSDKKIESLTAEQQAKFPFYVEKWLAIGLSTDRTDKEACKKALAKVYACAGLPAPTEFIFVDSPLEGSKEAAKLIQSKDIQSQLYNAGYGAQDANWLAFYDFFKNETEVTGLEPITGLIELAQHCGFWWPFEDTVIVSSKPTEIHMVNKVLHRDLGAAILYEDGFAVYALNGIRMDKRYVMTPAKDLSVKDVMKEQNVDIRRELLKKIGLERFVKETEAKELDRLVISVQGKEITYQLLDIKLGDDVTARVLKMDSPSIDTIHVEGVEDEGPNACKTVKEALAWRAGFTDYSEYEEPIALS